MAFVCASKAGRAASRMLTSAPSLIPSPSKPDSNAASRSKAMPCVKRK